MLSPDKSTALSENTAARNSAPPSTQMGPGSPPGKLSGVSRPPSARLQAKKEAGAAYQPWAEEDSPPKIRSPPRAKARRVSLEEPKQQQQSPAPTAPAPTAKRVRSPGQPDEERDGSAKRSKGPEGVRGMSALERLMTAQAGGGCVEEGGKENLVALALLSSAPVPHVAGAQRKEGAAGGGGGVGVEGSGMGGGGGGASGSVGGKMTAEERTRQKVKRQEEVLQAIGAGEVTEKRILDKVGDSRYTREILRRLLAQGVVSRGGKGGSNDPFLYTVVHGMLRPDGSSFPGRQLVDPGLEVRLRRIEAKIIALLPPPLPPPAHTTTEKQIRLQVGDNTGTGKALRRLVAAGRVAREGKGGVGDPYRYSLTPNPAPDTPTTTTAVDGSAERWSGAAGGAGAGVRGQEGLLAAAPPALHLLLPPHLHHPPTHPPPEDHEAGAGSGGEEEKEGEEGGALGESELPLAPPACDPQPLFSTKHGGGVQGLRRVMLEEGVGGTERGGGGEGRVKGGMGSGARHSFSPKWARKYKLPPPPAPAPAHQPPRQEAQGGSPSLKLGVGGGGGWFGEGGVGAYLGQEGSEVGVVGSGSSGSEAGGQEEEEEDREALGHALSHALGPRPAPTPPPRLPPSPPHCSPLLCACVCAGVCAGGGAGIPVGMEEDEEDRCSQHSSAPSSDLPGPQDPDPSLSPPGKPLPAAAGPVQPAGSGAGEGVCGEVSEWGGHGDRLLGALSALGPLGASLNASDEAHLAASFLA